MVSTSGAQLLPQDAVEILKDSILPHTTILTPNLPEAKLLLKTAGQNVEDPSTVEDLISMAKAIKALGPSHVLLKGGHLPLSRNKIVSSGEAEHHVVVDVLQTKDETVILESPYIQSRNTHGTGCSLACMLFD